MREDYTWNIVVVHLEVCFTFTQIKLAILALYTRRVGNSLRKDGKKEREKLCTEIHKEAKKVVRVLSLISLFVF